MRVHDVVADLELANVGGEVLEFLLENRLLYC
jgi:hypothetical protein